MSLLDYYAILYTMIEKKPTSNKSLTMPIEVWVKALQIGEAEGLPIGQAIAKAIVRYWAFLSQKDHPEQDKDSET